MARDCRICGETKPEKDFRLDKRSNSRAYKCRDCENAHRREKAAERRRNCPFSKKRRRLRKTQLRAQQIYGREAQNVFTLDEIQDYLWCPYRYLLYHVEKIRKPLPVVVAEYAMHKQALDAAIIHRATPEQMVEVFADQWDRGREYMSPGGLREIDRDKRIAMASGMYHAFCDVELPFIPKAKFAKDVVTPAVIRGITIQIRVDYESKGWRIVTELVPRAIKNQVLKFSPYLCAPMILPGVRDFGILIVPCAQESGKIIRFHERKHHRKPPVQRWMRKVIRDSAEAIRTGVFPRISPESARCSVNTCEYWSYCTGINTDRYNYRSMEFAKAIIGETRGIASWISSKSF